MHGFVVPPSSRPRTLAVIAPGLACVSLLLGPATADAGVPPPPPPEVVEGTIVLQTGDTPTGGPAVNGMSVAPFVNAADQVGFTGTFDDGDHFVFIDSAVVFSGSDDAMAGLELFETQMDSNGMGAWVYAPNTNGAQAIYNDLGLMAAQGDAAVGIMGMGNYTFLSSPTMTADGTIYWRSGIDTDGDGGTDYRVFSSTPDGTLASAVVLLTSGDPIDMFTLDDNAEGISPNYALSEDGAHRIHVLNMEGDTATDGFVWVDGMLVAREGDDNGGGDNWDNFGLVSINAAGNYVFSGDTDGPMGSDDFIAYNGTIVIRQGDTLDNVALERNQQNAGLRFLSINDDEQAVHAWAHTGGGFGFRETIFFACDAANLDTSSQEVLTSVDDVLDIDGDGMGDYTITNVLTGGPTIARAQGEDPVVYANLELDDGAAVSNAMVALPVTCCGNGAVDPGEDCDDGNDDDTDDCLPGCIAASCGDGVVQDGVEECDDGNTDDGDECNSDCTLPEDTDTTADPTDTTGADGTGTTGADETGTSGVDGTGTSNSGGGSGPMTATLTNGNNTLSGGDSTSDGDTDTDSGSGGVAEPVDGCGCRTRDDQRRPGALWGLLGLGLLGLRRRRRR